MSLVSLVASGFATLIWSLILMTVLEKLGGTLVAATLVLLFRDGVPGSGVKRGLLVGNDILLFDEDEDDMTTIPN